MPMSTHYYLYHNLLTMLNFYQWNKTFIKAHTINSKSLSDQVAVKPQPIHVYGFKLKKYKKGKKDMFLNTLVSQTLRGSHLSNGGKQTHQHKLFRNSVIKKRFISLHSEREPQIIKNHIRKQQYYQISLQKYLNKKLRQSDQVNTFNSITPVLSSSTQRYSSLKSKSFITSLLTESTEIAHETRGEAIKKSSTQNQIKNGYSAYKSEAKKQRQNLNVSKKASNLMNKYEYISKLAIKKKKVKEQNLRLLTIIPLDNQMINRHHQQEYLQRDEHIQIKENQDAFYDGQKRGFSKQSIMKTARVISLVKNGLKLATISSKSLQKQEILEPWSYESKPLKQ